MAKGPKLPKPRRAPGARRTRRWMLAAIGAAFVSVGCLSPTLPLPPPDKPDVEGPDQDGYVTLTGVVPSYALAQALNLRTGEIAGQVTDETGRYEFRLRAEIDDECVFWYNDDTERSPSVQFKIR
ncbi:MAG: hypothetical protein H6718_13870 [Polyangiaceae bacterium]|nr:hypothetical protein [Myxococcales bacterium]MCB9586485.1 hypothetical protein [Polyangiaceae bacterium]MCB9605992.1 hypothetical protein [Polyangiaceae bacterium]